MLSKSLTIRDHFPLMLVLEGWQTVCYVQGPFKFNDNFVLMFFSFLSGKVFHEKIQKPSVRGLNNQKDLDYYSSKKMDSTPRHY